jgi:hypothetical protein
MSLALFSGGERAATSTAGIPLPERCSPRRTRHLHLLTRWRDMKLPDPFRDWTAVDYLAIVVVLVVCLANALLR